MSAQQWYLISYDIRQPRRLRRTQRLLRRQATALLESLYAFEGNEQALAKLREDIARETRANEDDVLIYALRADKPVHRWGRACLPAGLYDFSLPALIEHRETREISLEN